MRRITTLLAAAALLLAACGGSSSGDDGAKNALERALRNLQEMQGVTAAITLQSDASSLQALAAEDGGSLSPEDAQRILDSSLTVSGTNAEDPARAAAQMVLNVAGDDAVALRTVDKVLYVRADVRRLLEVFGQDPSMADAFVQQAAASGLDFVQPLVEGRWLSLSGLEQAFGQASSGAGAEADKRKVVEQLARSLENATTVTSEGEDDVGEHLVATVDLRDAVGNLKDAAEDLGGGLPGGGGMPSSEQIPDRDIQVDLWVRDDRLTQIEFDFLQLEDLGESPIPAGVERLALRVELEEFSGEVEAPADAVPVDFAKLMQGMFSGIGGTATPAP